MFLSGNNFLFNGKYLQRANQKQTLFLALNRMPNPVVLHLLY
jgi:hypothetical protein